MKKLILLLFLSVGFNSLSMNMLLTENKVNMESSFMQKKSDKKKRINKKRKRKCQKWGRKSYAG